MRYLQETTIDTVKVDSSTRFVLTIGAANIDLSGHSNQALKNSESNPGKLELSVGGVGRNIADNLARLGADSWLLSIVGDDHWGQQILSLSEQAGVNTELCVRRQNARSSTYLSLHNPDGEMRLALSDMDIISSLGVDDIVRFESKIKKATVLVLDANLSDTTLSHCFSYAHPAIFADPVSSLKAHKLEPYLSFINTLKPNHFEAEILANMTINSRDDIAKAANVLHGKGVANVFLSSGAQGGYWSTNFGRTASYIPTVLCGDKSVVNVTGAGDALMAALAYGRLADWDKQETGKFAMAAAAVAVSVDSTINSTLSESLVLQSMGQK